MNLLTHILFFIIGSAIFTVVRGNEHEERVVPSKEEKFKQYSDCLYEKLNDQTLNHKAFEIALKGYFNLKSKKKLDNDRYLTIVDMSLSANKKRLYLIDILDQVLVYKSLVAHGVGTGEEYAETFSNTENSHQSSLGFYLTGETYNGKHNFSLKLDGLESFNNKARERGVVIHAADYVSDEFIKSNGRLGRSYGCPALPHENYFDIVSKIKNKSCLFIYFPDKKYLKESKIGKSLLNYKLINS